jgi:hypothetical protein
VGEAGNNVSALIGDALLKLDRAKQHISDIITTLLRLERSYTSCVENHSDGCVSLKYSSGEESQLLQQVALILGDAMHNLRTALDYAWVAARKRLDPAVNVGHIKFPFRDTLQELDAAMAGAKINLLAPRLFEGIRTDIQPYGGGNDMLVRLHRFDIEDKHLLLTPVIGHASISGATVKDKSGVVHEVNTDAVSGNGALRVTFFTGHQIQEHGQISIGVLFDERSAFKAWEVIAVVDTLTAHVLNTLRKIDSWI